MKISNNPTALSERLILEAEAERRANEKAVTQATSGDLGVGKEDKRVSDKAEDLAASMDTTRISAQALNRYRTLAGEKAADEQQQPTEEESFSRRSYQMSEDTRAAAWKKRIADVSGRTEEPEAEAVEEPGLKSASREDTFFSSLDKTEESKSGDAADEEDPTKEIREKIKSVQSKLTMAQQRLAQATAKAGEAGEPENAGAVSSPPAASVAAAGAAGSVPGGQAGAQAEVAAAESEVNALAGELMKLYQQLMQASKGPGE